MGPDRRRTRILLIGAFLFFFIPIMGAWLLNLYAPGWHPFGTVNHGTLVRPVRPVTADSLQHVDGSAMDPAYLSGHWTLVHLLEGACARSCIEALKRSHQVQQALGEDIQRVQLILVLAQSMGARLAGLPPGVTIAVAHSDWLASFSFADTAPGQGLGIYLVDPQAYLMMRYPPGVDQRGLLTDLERLLKLSKIG